MSFDASDINDGDYNVIHLNGGGELSATSSFDPYTLTGGGKLSETSAYDIIFPQAGGDCGGDCEYNADTDFDVMSLIGGNKRQYGGYNSYDDEYDPTMTEFDVMSLIGGQSGGSRKNKRGSKAAHVEKMYTQTEIINNIRGLLGGRLNQTGGASDTVLFDGNFNSGIEEVKKINPSLKLYFVDSTGDVKVSTTSDKNKIVDFSRASTRDDYGHSYAQFTTDANMAKAMFGQCRTRKGVGSILIFIAENVSHLMMIDHTEWINFDKKLDQKVDLRAVQDLLEERRNSVQGAGALRTQINGFYSPYNNDMGMDMDVILDMTRLQAGTGTTYRGAPINLNYIGGTMCAPDGSIRCDGNCKSLGYGNSNTESDKIEMKMQTENIPTMSVDELPPPTK